MDAVEAAARKRELRTQIRAARAEQRAHPDYASARDRHAHAIRDHALPVLDWLAALPETPARVALFASMPGEPDVSVLAAAVMEKGAAVMMPVASQQATTGGRPVELDWALWDGRSDLAPSPARGFGPEPAGPRLGSAALATAHVIFAPALAVGPDGSRLGHGGGYYDRALQHKNPQTPVIAIVNPGEVLPAGIIPMTAHDQRIDAVLTAEGLLFLDRTVGIENLPR